MILILHISLILGNRARMWEDEEWFMLKTADFDSKPTCQMLGISMDHLRYNLPSTKA